MEQESENKAESRVRRRERRERRERKAPTAAGSPYAKQQQCTSRW